MEQDTLDYNAVESAVLRTLEAPTWRWYLIFAVCLFGVGMGGAALVSQLTWGIGNWGMNNPNGWGVEITNFVFWVGIAHSGTLISAVLYLFRARFRNSIYRIAEAMTVFAVMTAGLFPIVHLGRPWFFYWLLPYPNQRGLWPNFRSPLIWDVFAVSTYFIVSATFFFIGLIPDIAVARDRAVSWPRKALYSFASLGWTGRVSQWKHYTSAYLLFAAFATPLVVSVHSVVSWDFAMGIVPGWHATIFAPYFVAGAIFSGVAMVISLVVPLRRIFRLEALITVEHFEATAKLIIVTSTIVTYSYVTEFYIAWFSNNRFERYQFWYRVFGEYSAAFWIMLFCNCIAPLALWFRRCRRSIAFLLVLSLLINVGMWLERFNIIVQSLSRDFDPSAWGGYNFSWTDVAYTIAGFSWFGMWMALFIKFFPSVAIVEIKEILPVPRRKEAAHAG